MSPNVLSGLDLQACSKRNLLNVLFEASAASSDSQPIGIGKCSITLCPWYKILCRVGLIQNQLIDEFLYNSTHFLQKFPNISGFIGIPKLMRVQMSPKPSMRSSSIPKISEATCCVSAKLEMPI